LTRNHAGERVELLVVVVNVTELVVDVTEFVVQVVIVVQVVCYCPTHLSVCGFRLLLVP
jgi:hypothetical protein